MDATQARAIARGLPWAERMAMEMAIRSAEKQAAEKAAEEAAQKQLEQQSAHLLAQTEAANITTSGYRKIQSATEDSLFFLQEWQDISNAREENAHAISLGLEPPEVNTQLREGFFGDDTSDTSQEKTA